MILSSISQSLKFKTMEDQELQQKIQDAVTAAMTPFNEKLDKLMDAKSEDSSKLPSFEARMTRAVENFSTSNNNLKGKLDHDSK